MSSCPHENSMRLCRRCGQFYYRTSRPQHVSWVRGCVSEEAQSRRSRSDPVFSRNPIRTKNSVSRLLRGLRRLTLPRRQRCSCLPAHITYKQVTGLAVRFLVQLALRPRRRPIGDCHPLSQTGLLPLLAMEGRWKSGSRKSGRPKIDAEIGDLIRRMSSENPTWETPSIRSELRTPRLMLDEQHLT